MNDDSLEFALRAVIRGLRAGRGMDISSLSAFNVVEAVEIVLDLYMKRTSKRVFFTDKGNIEGLEDDE